MCIYSTMYAYVDTYVHMFSMDNFLYIESLIVENKKLQDLDWNDKATIRFETEPH